MKSIRFASVLALFLLIFAAPRLAGAQTPGQSAVGSPYQFAFEDGYTKYSDFSARILDDGSTSGSLFYSDEAPLTVQDVDGTGDKPITYQGAYIKADLDGLVIANKNQAVMSGTILDSSVRNYIGQRVLLTVEDNGDNTRVPDHLTWGVYSPVVRNWTPSDAELKDDPGVGMRWLATDAERKDDVGIKMPKDESFNTRTFPVNSYSFDTPPRAAGDIIVTP
jgi:hypothetical protein